MRLGENKYEIWSLEIDKIIYKFIEERYRIGRFINIYKKSKRSKIIRGFNRKNKLKWNIKIGNYNINGIRRRKEYS